MSESSRRKHPVTSTSQWIGVIIGIVVGVLYLRISIQSLFVGPGNDPVAITCWAGILLGMFSFLPLGFLGIFKPRLGAYGMMLAWVIMVACEGIYALHSGEKPGWMQSSVYVTLPFWSAAGFLFYSSLNRESHKEWSVNFQGPGEVGGQRRGLLANLRIRLLKGGRKGLAQTTAVIFGVLVGALTFRWGVYGLKELALQGVWIATVSLGVITLTLLPASLLGILRPRAAAYGLLASLTIVLSFLIYLSLFPPLAINAKIRMVVFSIFITFSFPSAIVASLLLYACGGFRIKKTGRG